MDEQRKLSSGGNKSHRTLFTKWGVVKSPSFPVKRVAPTAEGGFFPGEKPFSPSRYGEKGRPCFSFLGKRLQDENRLIDPFLPLLHTTTLFFIYIYDYMYGEKEESPGGDTAGAGQGSSRRPSHKLIVIYRYFIDKV